MGKKTNTEFLAAFIELESACNALLGSKRSGVTEYINALKERAEIPGKDEVLPKLIAYRKIRNKLAHEDGALEKDSDAERADIKWLLDFKKSVEKRRDPISKSEKKRGGWLKILAACAAVIVIGVIVAATILL